MSLCEIRWFSHVLQKQVATTVILPDKGKPPFATYYLLHGLSDDHTIWLRRTRIEWYVRDLPLIVVMPDGFRGFYTDNERGPAYAKYINEQLVSFIERTFPAKRSRSARCIGGLSMGGYGAMRAALGYPHLYASANSHSGAVMHGGFKIGKDAEPWHFEVFGKDPRGSRHDLLKLAADARKNKVALPKLLIDCGVDDFLIDHNRQFHQKLGSLGVEHTYNEFPGEHSWDYWDEQVREALTFHVRALRLQ